MVGAVLFAECPMLTVVVATGNPGKLKEMQAFLGDLSWDLVLKPQDIEVDETGQTFLENARLKASEVAKATGQMAIADDSGLEIDALDGAPGIYSARYAPDPEACIDRVLAELKDEPNRGAQFVCALAIAAPDGTITLETEGICRGEILQRRQGQRGFGYDPIFYVPAVGKSFAEMGEWEKDTVSHRAVAFAQILPQLRSLHTPAKSEPD